MGSMILRPAVRSCAILLLLSSLSACASTSQRNLRETVVVRADHPVTATNVEFILELKRSGERVPLAELDSYLSGDRAAGLPDSIRSSLEEKRRKVEETLPDAARLPMADVVIARPSEDLPFSSANIVAYVKARTRLHVFCSLDEIGEVLSWKEVAPDLRTVLFTHPSFEPSVLARLRAELEEAGVEPRQAQTSPSELKALRILAAAGRLERQLRETGATLPEGTPLLITATLGQAHSPKLTAALRTEAALEQIIRCGDPDVIRSLVYLAGKGVIEIDVP
ncbi:MAG: hypothetical protein ACE5GW_00525 [Planctomycetota bacterium]